MFIHGGTALFAPMPVKGEEHRCTIQVVGAKPEIKSYPTFDRTLSKWKLSKNRFLALETYQKMVTLANPILSVAKAITDISKVQYTIIFLFSELLQSTA